MALPAAPIAAALAREAVKRAAPYVVAGAAAAGRGIGRAWRWGRDKFNRWRERRRRCKDCCEVGPFSSLRCPSGQQRHHIVPEYALKHPVTKARIPGMPSQGRGAAICLEGNAAVPGTEHNIAQTTTRLVLAGSGNAQGQATLTDAKIAGIAGVAAIRPECVPEATLKVEQAFAGIDGNRMVTSNY